MPQSLFEIAESFSVDVSESENSITVQVELPGIDPQDIDISVSDDTLTLKGETRENRIEEGETFRRMGKSIRSFSRSIELPCRITPEDAKASFKNGTLEIVLPKCKSKEIRGISIEVR